MILVSIGSNLRSYVGSPTETLHATIVSMRDAGIVVLNSSPFYRTIAWPDPADPPFINAICKIGTALPPDALLCRLHEIERKFGRERSVRNAPRTLDIDIIDYDGRVEAGPPQLPHPRLETRNFVLIPLRDIAPGWRHPVSGRSVGELIAALPPAERSLTAL